ncbi:hypothetical protein HDF16_005234 [Granulicella aggregans]|uniref:Transposase IS801/IS1294 domain-containing protein n=1 Tax=Granulicella aggregans TaxID=474949 RepID=A0A7W8E5T8_9BACT|nr:hypothetical protein [Granulicella aggregans]
MLHTWNQRLQHHPHVHCVIAAGGLAPDHASWISSRRTFFLPVEVLGRVFRGKFLAGLKAAFREGKLEFHGHLASLSEPCRFTAWLRVLFRHDWVVYSKQPFGGPEHALRYLGAYTHRVGISNSRLVSFADGKVSFRWRDSAHGTRKCVMSLPADEFLRRFLLHLVPRGFVRIRNFAFLANRQPAKLLPLCFRLLGSSADHARAENITDEAKLTAMLLKCSLCSGTMRIVGRLSSVQLLPRSPPQQEGAAACSLNSSLEPNPCDSMPAPSAPQVALACSESASTFLD